MEGAPSAGRDGGGGGGGSAWRYGRPRAHYDTSVHKSHCSACETAPGGRMHFRHAARNWPGARDGPWHILPYGDGEGGGGVWVDFSGKVGEANEMTQCLGVLLH